VAVTPRPTASRRELERRCRIDPAHLESLDTMSSQLVMPEQSGGPGIRRLVVRIDSATRLTRGVPWLCVPFSRRVCPFRRRALRHRTRHTLLGLHRMFKGTSIPRVDDSKRRRPTRGTRSARPAGPATVIGRGDVPRQAVSGTSSTTSWLPRHRPHVGQGRPLYRGRGLRVIGNVSVTLRHPLPADEGLRSAAWRRARVVGSSACRTRAEVDRRGARGRAG